MFCGLFPRAEDNHKCFDMVLNVCIPELPPVTTTSLFDGLDIFGTIPAKLEANGSSFRARRHSMFSSMTSTSEEENVVYRTVMFKTSKLPGNL